MRSSISSIAPGPFRDTPSGNAIALGSGLFPAATWDPERIRGDDGNVAGGIAARARKDV